MKNSKNLMAKSKRERIMKKFMAWTLLICMIVMVTSIFVLTSFGVVFISEAVGISIKSLFITAVISTVGFIGVMVTN